MLAQITPRLDAYEGIALQAMDSVALLNRVDRKYVIAAAQLPALLAQLQEAYFVLEIDRHRAFTYNTAYFDTPDFQFYRDHHNGHSNRIKVRCRTYVETGTSFFEIKRKYNGTRTDKYRRSIPAIMSELDELAYDAVHTKYSKHPVDHLERTLNNWFSRVTLVSKSMTERCTIDFDVRFRTPGGTEAFLNDFAIVELKQSKTDVQSPVVKALKAMRVYPTSISKYSYGLMLCTPTIKHNAFKALAHRLQKIAAA